MLHFLTSAEAGSSSFTCRKATVSDLEGRSAIYSHKARIEIQLAKVKRRGAAMASTHDALQPVLNLGEK